MAEFQAVITRFKEDVAWARQLPFPCVIYNKGVEDTGLENEHPIIRRENVGREGEAFLHHIIEHYDSLPEYLVFLQGNPFDHCKNLFLVLEDVGEPETLVPLGTNWKIEPLEHEYNWEGFKECLLELCEVVGVPKGATISYASGAQYIVPRELILARPKSFYESLIERLNKELNPLAGWALERLWPYVYGAHPSGGGIPVLNVELEAGKEAAALAGAVKSDAEFYFFTGVGKKNLMFSDQMLQLFRDYKHKILKEDDLVLAYDTAPSSFFIGRSTLLQHRTFLEKNKLDAKKLQERGVPVLTLAG